MPAPPQKTNAIVVLTGGPGRIDRALELLEDGQAKRVLISGVAREVKPKELAAEYKRPLALFDCCVALGVDAADTRSNATEVGSGVARRGEREVGVGANGGAMGRGAREK